MKKLLIGFLIVSLLMVGVVATASAWEDSERVNVQGTIGSVDISTDVGAWVIFISPEDLLPGEKGTVNVKITNDGTRDVLMTTTVTDGQNSSSLNITVPGPDVIPAGSYGTYVITVNIVGGAVQEDLQGQMFTFTVWFTAEGIT